MRVSPEEFTMKTLEEEMELRPYYAEVIAQVQTWADRHSYVSFPTEAKDGLLFVDREPVEMDIYAQYPWFAILLSNEPDVLIEALKRMKDQQLHENDPCAVMIICHLMIWQIAFEEIGEEVPNVLYEEFEEVK